VVHQQSFTSEGVFMRKLVSVAVTVGFSVALLLHSRPSSAFDVDVSINVAPPELPVYEQPEIPGDGYIWTPGYWAWGDGDYYWVPGTWVLAPQPGYLWTPGYWGWDNGVYLWHGGYWGTQIGFYGGVNYGFGYFGHGYDGGYWDHGAFRYNRAYSNVRNDTHITNVYNKTVINNISVNHVSFNGGNGGIQAHADEHEMAAEHAHHLAPVSAQMHQEQLAHGNPDLRNSANHGHPAIAATSRAGQFSGHGVIAAHDAAPLAHAPAAVNHAPTEQHTPAAAFTHTPQHENQAPTREYTPPAQQHVTPQVQQHVTPQVQQHVPEPRENLRSPPQPEQREQREAQHAPAGPPPAQQHEQHAPAAPAEHAEQHHEEQR
jgi:hypothetical protein